MTETPIYDLLKERFEVVGGTVEDVEVGLAQLAEFGRRLKAFEDEIDAPLPHRRPSLTRINHTINERLRAQWQLS